MMLILGVSAIGAFSQGKIEVDPSKIIKSVNEGPIGAVTNFNLDSDTHRFRISGGKTADALSSMGTKILRFPYGQLSNNYIWTTLPADPNQAPSTNLTPRVAANTKAPGHIPGTASESTWSWSTNADNSLKNSMDFNEFMDMAQSLNAKTVVCVGVMGHKYVNGIPYDSLKRVATEWVQYAKDNNLKVDYWQVGNEQDHPNNRGTGTNTTNKLTSSEYEALYLDFVAAMKAVDSTIKVGPGLINNNSWYNLILDSGADVDFLTAHQYLYGYDPSDTLTYNVWKNHTGYHRKNPLNAYDRAVAKNRPDMEIVITESGTTPMGKWHDANDVNATQNDLLRSLVWFEQAMGLQSAPNVSYTLYWGTRSPWQGETEDDDLANLLSNDENSTLKPTALVTKLINESLGNELVQSTEEAGFVRSYASWDSESNDLIVYLLNKDTEQISLELEVDNIIFENNAVEVIVYTGTGQNDTAPTTTPGTAAPLKSTGYFVQLDPLSVTIVKIKDVKRLPEYAFEKEITLQNVSQGEFVRNLNDQLISHFEESPNDDKVFKIEDAGNGAIYLKADKGNGGYVRASSVIGGNVTVSATQDDQSKFFWNQTSEGQLAFQSYADPDLYLVRNQGQFHGLIQSGTNTGINVEFSYEFYEEQCADYSAYYLGNNSIRLYHKDMGWTANFKYLCKNNACYTAILNANGYYFYDFSGSENETFTFEAKFQDNNTPGGQYLFTESVTVEPICSSLSF